MAENTDVTGNCSELANSLPPDLVAETGGGIILIYCYAVLVVLATLGLYIKYLSSPALLERSELVRTLLRELNIQYFLVALFSSVPVFLPKSNIFSNSVLKIIFGGGMVHFLQLTVVQLGGEASMLANPGARVNLAAVPLCCFAGFSWTKLPLTRGSLALVRHLISQVPLTQFTLLYIIMSLDLSGVGQSAQVRDLLSALQSVSWLAGIWGLQMLAGLVGETLASSNWATRQSLIFSLAGLIELVDIVSGVLLWFQVVPCVSTVLPPVNLAVLFESCLILLCAAGLAIKQFQQYTEHGQQIDLDSTGGECEQGKVGITQEKLEDKQEETSLSLQ